MTRRSIADAIASVLVLLAVVGCWWAASHAQWISKVFLPTPEAAVASLVEGLTTGDLREQSAQTIARMLEGWLLACLIGVALGALIGTSSVARAWLQPMLEFMRPLPASALMPLAISIFGLGSNMVLAVVAFGATWPVLLATLHGFSSIEPRLREVAAGLQLPRRDFIMKLGLPGALPDILAGMRLSLTVSLIVAVVGEMIASQAGLGQALLLAARSFQASELFAGIILLGVIGFAANAALTAIERRTLRWQQP